jgi:hypothetical protein
MRPKGRAVKWRHSHQRPKKSTPRPSGNRICGANREFYAFFIMQKYYGLEGWRGRYFGSVTSGGKRGPAPARGSLRRPGQRGLAQEAGNANSGPRRCWQPLVRRI